MRPLLWAELSSSSAYTACAIIACTISLCSHWQIHIGCLLDAALVTISLSSTLQTCLMPILRGNGIASTSDTAPSIVYIAHRATAVNGLDRKRFDGRADVSMVDVAAARSRSAALAVGNGISSRSARETQKLRSCLNKRGERHGNAAIVVRDLPNWHTATTTSSGNCLPDISLEIMGELQKTLTDDYTAVAVPNSVLFVARNGKHVPAHCLRTLAKRSSQVSWISGASHSTTHRRMSRGRLLPLGITVRILFPCKALLFGCGQQATTTKSSGAECMTASVMSTLRAGCILSMFSVIMRATSIGLATRIMSMKSSVVVVVVVLKSLETIPSPFSTTTIVFAVPRRLLLHRPNNRLFRKYQRLLDRHSSLHQDLLLSVRRLPSIIQLLRHVVGGCVKRLQRDMANILPIIILQSGVAGNRQRNGRDFLANDVLGHTRGATHIRSSLARRLPTDGSNCPRGSHLLRG